MSKTLHYIKSRLLEGGGAPSVFEKIKDSKTDLKSCDFILCTGLFDEQEDDLEYYKNLNKLHSIDGMQNIEDVSKDIQKILTWL